MRDIEKTVTWDIHILMTQNLYSHKKPCHELKNPKQHQWSLDISRGCECGCHESDARYECYNCGWGFDAENLVKALPVGNDLFE